MQHLCKQVPRSCPRYAYCCTKCEMFPIGLNPNCSRTEAFYVLVLDSTGSARQLVTTLISTVLFGMLSLMVLELLH